MKLFVRVYFALAISGAAYLSGQDQEKPKPPSDFPVQVSEVTMLRIQGLLKDQRIAQMQIDQLIQGVCAENKVPSGSCGPLSMGTDANGKPTYSISANK